MMPVRVPKIAIVGGSGLYDPALMKDLKTVKVATPYGEPSSPVDVGTFLGVKMAFLPRHGRGHTIPPHKVNYRATYGPSRASASRG
jgi:5'-methylthioadenosine phosphorylase